MGLFPHYRFVEPNPTLPSSRDRVSPISALHMSNSASAEFAWTGRESVSQLQRAIRPETWMPATRTGIFFRYSGAGAIAATSRFGPVFGPGFAQRISPRRLAAAVAALDSVMVMRS